MRATKARPVSPVEVHHVLVDLAPDGQIIDPARVLLEAVLLPETLVIVVGEEAAEGAHVEQDAIQGEDFAGKPDWALLTTIQP